MQIVSTVLTNNSAHLHEVNFETAGKTVLPSSSIQLHHKG